MCLSKVARYHVSESNSPRSFGGEYHEQNRQRKIVGNIFEVYISAAIGQAQMAWNFLEKYGAGSTGSELARLGVIISYAIGVSLGIPSMTVEHC